MAATLWRALPWRKDYIPIFKFSPCSGSLLLRCRFEKNTLLVEFCVPMNEKMIKQEGEANIAAFISEPVTGGTWGVSPPSGIFSNHPGDLRPAWNLLVMDEVITGFGRTGKNFGIDHWGVIPDLIITGKGSAAGIFSGAVIIHEKVYDLFWNPVDRHSPWGIRIQETHYPARLAWLS